MNRFIPTPFALDMAALMALAASIAIAAHLMKGRKPEDLKDKGNKKLRKTVLPTLTVTALSVLVLLASIALYAAGSSRGMTMDHWKGMRIDEIAETNAKTPKSEKLPDKANGHVVILYRYGCPDCEAVRDELEETISEIGIEDVHWVATSSEDGKRLVEQTKVQDVPAVVYMRHEPLGNGATTTHMSAYARKGNEITVDEAALKRVRLLQEKKR